MVVPSWYVSIVDIRSSEGRKEECSQLHFEGILFLLSLRFVSLLPRASFKNPAQCLKLRIKCSLSMIQAHQGLQLFKILTVNDDVQLKLACDVSLLADCRCAHGCLFTFNSSLIEENIFPISISLSIFSISLRVLH